MIEIKNPKKITEFEIHAELYMSLKNLGYNVRGEVLDISIRKLNIQGMKQSRFDLVIFKDNKAFLIIEVKDTLGHTKNTRQYRKYQLYGLPIIYCMGYNQINQTIESVKSYF